MESVGFKMSANEAAAVIRIIDTDGNGNIDSAEFLDWWQEYAMEQVFLKHDKDGSGELSKAEITGLLKELGLVWESEEEFQELFDQLDPDGNESVSFAELVQWFSVFDAQKVFDKYDTDGSKTLGAVELNNVLSDLGLQVTPEFLDQAFSMLDVDGSGALGFDEFLPWWIAEQRQRKQERLADSRGNKMSKITQGRRRSEQLDLSTKDAAYLKMSAQRERNMQEAQRHLQNILEAIAGDYAFDQGKFMSKYFKPMGSAANDALLRRLPSTMRMTR